MVQKKTINIITWVLSSILAILFVLAGVPKIMQMESIIQMFTVWGYPAWFALTIGVVEVIGGISLLIPRISFYSAIMLVIVMVGASYTHIAAGESMQVLRPLIFMILLGGVIWGRCKK